MPGRIRTIEAVTLLLAFVSVGAGLWAMIDPHAFYANAATYPPYSRHFIHDIGAFQLGLGSCLVAGLLLRDALLAVLAGNAIGALAHLVGHVVDRSEGGKSSDPITFGVIAFAFVLLVAGRWRLVTSGRDRAHTA